MIESVAIMIRLPEFLAQEWPDTKDNGPPHITLLYIGEVNARDYQRVLTATRAVAYSIPPLLIEMTDYGEFENREGDVIPHMIPRVTSGPPLSGIHERLYRAVTSRGVEVKHIRDSAFKPHATLAYMDPGLPYTGPRPKGRFIVNHLDIWGESESSRFGYKQIPLNPMIMGSGGSVHSAISFVGGHF